MQVQDPGVLTIDRAEDTPTHKSQDTDLIELECTETETKTKTETERKFEANDKDENGSMCDDSKAPRAPPKQTTKTY